MSRRPGHLSLLGPRHLLELVDQLDRHRRADQRLAVGDDPHRLRDLLDRGVLEQVAGGAALDRLVEVGLLVGDGQHDDLRRRHALLDREAGLDAGPLRHPDVEQHDVRRHGSARAVPSTPSPASPTTSMPSSLASSMVRPRRKSSWSSTTSTRIGSLGRRPALVVTPVIMARLDADGACPIGPPLARVTRSAQLQRDHAVVVAAAAVDDRRALALLVDEQVEVVADQLHLVERLVERHRRWPGGSSPAPRAARRRSPRSGRPCARWTVVLVARVRGGDRLHAGQRLADRGRAWRPRWTRRRSAARRIWAAILSRARSRAAILSSAAASARITGPFEKAVSSTLIGAVVLSRVAFALDLDLDPDDAVIVLLEPGELLVT